MNVNRRVVVVERPRYIVPTANCFRLEQAPVPQVGEGQLRLRTLWLSLDVMLYARVKRVSADAEPVNLGDVMVGPTVGRVEESRHPDYKAGELLSGFWGWQGYGISEGRRLRKLDFGLKQPSHALSAYGTSAFGAYVALTELAPPLAGETVVVGTAIGGLGQIAGQIAKIKGCRVVGIAGGTEKCRIAVERLGYDACVDHRARDFVEQLRAACGKGVDVFVDTIGGRALDAVVPLLNKDARIAACGLMATPHFGEAAYSGKYQSSMSLLNEIINRRLQVRGLVVFDHLRHCLEPFHREMTAWIDSGRIKLIEDIVVGLEQAPDAFQGLFEGRNRGKLLVKIAD
ncbi:MAG: NADP-dependent oxidoreductase [Nevskia sp.]|nr:NADP-dependent oxidoreductase [Nevskia sp.]